MPELDSIRRKHLGSLVKRKLGSFLAYLKSRRLLSWHSKHGTRKEPAAGADSMPALDPVRLEHLAGLLKRTLDSFLAYLESERLLDWHSRYLGIQKELAAGNYEKAVAMTKEQIHITDQEADRMNLLCRYLDNAPKAEVERLERGRQMYGKYEGALEFLLPLSDATNSLRVYIAYRIYNEPRMTGWMALQKAADLKAKLAMVCDEDSFVAFISALADDKADEDATRKNSSLQPFSPGANGWENGTITSFLEAAAAWAQDSKDGMPHCQKTGNPWKRCAEIIYMGKIYE